jgi:hypothetical protein
MVVPYPAHHRRLEAQACSAKSDVRRGTAQVFSETADILQPRTDLLCVEVDAKAPEADQIQLTPTGKTSLAHAGSCYFYQPVFAAVQVRTLLVWGQTKTSCGTNQYLFYKFFTWNIFSNKLSQD